MIYVRGIGGEGVFDKVHATEHYMKAVQYIIVILIIMLMNHFMLICQPFSCPKAVHSHVFVCFILFKVVTK